MKIDAFKAKSVFGYLPFDLQFSANPTILVGPNGSGKTTALRMMQAMITPSLRDLLFISFKEAILTLSDASSTKVITARKSSGKLSLSVTGVDGFLEVSTDLLASLEPEMADARRIAESTRLLRVKYSDNPVFQAINALHAPVFLGLDRRNAGFQEGLSATMDAEEIVAREYGYRNATRAIRGSLGASLMEAQALVRDAFRRVRRLKDQQSERLRKKLLLTGFRYADISTGINFDQIRQDTQYLSQEDLENQRQQLITALASIGIDETDARKELDPFFQRVTLLSKRLSAFQDVPGMPPKDPEVYFEAWLNQSSLARLRELVGAVREFNDKSDQFLSRFQNFVSCINRFFADSHKTVEVDPVGLIKIHRPDGTEVPIEALSSGERQLLIMFGHIFFNSFGDRSNVFVIDEPELSLHIRWQEILVREMMDGGSRAQFIIATHSPEIVGELVENCVEV